MQFSVPQVSKIDQSDCNKYENQILAKLSQIFLIMMLIAINIQN